MTGISSSVGLISGIDYTSIVSQLMEIERIPVTYLENRTTKLVNQESALTNLTALFLTSSYMIQNLNKADAFNQCLVTSGNESLLKATKTGTTTPGVYTFTPVRTAMSQQTIAQGVASDTEPLGKTGTITIGKGWSLDGKNTYLSDINGGEGFSKGYIRITDGSGTRATIDLRSCVTMEDVLDTINNTHTIDVWAELDGDSIRLVDMSGGSENIKVQEVSNGKTAASLGLANLEGADSITGSSINRLSEKTSLSLLNDGNGVVFDKNSSLDLAFTCKDGKTFTVDFYKTTTTDEQDEGAASVIREMTMGDVINTINNAEGNDGRIVASIGGPDGKSLVITDTSQAYLMADPVQDPPEGDPKFTLPAPYDTSDYDFDEDGYIIYAAGNTVDGVDGERVLDPDATQTTLRQNTASPILRSLGLISGRWNSSEPVTFEGSVTSRDLLGSLDSPLMASLNGGYGMSSASAGEIKIQDRAGNTAVISMTQSDIDLMQSGSLNEAIAVLNEKMENAVWADKDGNGITYGDNVGVRIELNDAKTGLNMVDKSGGTTHNLILQDMPYEQPVLDENGDPVLDDNNDPVTTTVSPNILSSFGFKDVNTSSSTATGSNMNLQVVSNNTKLSDLNGGQGVTIAGGQIVITDSAGTSDTIYLDAKLHQTLGDIIDEINTMQLNSGPKVTARINDAGDGIEILDTSNGTGTFSIMDGTSSSRICSQLRIDQTVTQEDKQANGGVMSIVGSTTYEIEVEATDSLDDIRQKINDLGGNFSSTIIVDGSGSPYRLLISGGTTGELGSMNIDLSCLGLSTENMTEACDALLVYGDVNSSSGVMLTSSSNTFKNVINGMDLTILGTSTTPITVTSEKSSVDVKASITAFVENYNKFREQLNTDMFFDPDQEAGNVLYDHRLAKEFDQAISDALLKQVYDVPGINSLRSLGITIRSSLEDSGLNKSTGKLEFDETVFDEMWEQDPQAVQDFFFREMELIDDSGEVDEDGNLKTTTYKYGWAQKFMDVADSLVGTDVGKVYTELETLDRKITQNYERIEYMEARLAFKEQYMLNKFYAMEQAMAQMSSDMSTISSISTNWAANSSSTSSYY